MQVSHKREIEYRKDIDGLRAVAVLLVIFYHLGVKLVPAGLIGVDVFFVISGFLITQRILPDLMSGEFSLKAFYLRRIRRILPALVCVLIVTTIFSYLFFWVLYTPDPIRYMRSVLVSLLSASNVYFLLFRSVNYFDTGTGVYPLVHTWSLGVEEQFYIFWPLALLLMFRWLPKRGALVATSILCLSSFMTYYAFRNVYPLAVFYLPVTRAYELLIGALLAITWDDVRFCDSRLLNNMLSIFGFGLLVYSACFSYPDVFGRGVFLLFPCVGTALLIYTGKHSAVVNRVLSARPIVLVGLISYSLYLWHWPLIVFAKALRLPIGLQYGAAIFFLTFFLSILSWRYVEQPFRFKIKFGFIKSLVCFILIPIIVSCTLLERSDLVFSKEQQQIYRAAHDSKGPLALGCHRSYFWQGVAPLSERKCMLGYLKSGPTDALIVGDSHAKSAAGMLSVLLKCAGLKGYFISQASAAFLLGHNLREWNNKQPMKRNNLLKRVISRGRYKYVVMGGYWSQYSNELVSAGEANNATENYSLLREGLKNAVSVIVKSNSIPVIVLDTPQLLEISKYCGFVKSPIVAFLRGHGLLFLPNSQRCYHIQKTVLADQRKTRDILFILKKQFPTLILIDPNKIICREGKCYSSIAGTPLYYNNGPNSHLNYTGSELLGKLYLKQYKNPFK